MRQYRKSAHEKLHYNENKCEICGKEFLGPLDFGNTKQIFTLKILVKVTKKGPSTKEIRMWLKIGTKGS